MRWARWRTGCTAWWAAWPRPSPAIAAWSWPRPGGGLTHAEARLRTPYGLARCAWTIAAGAITVEVTVPPNGAADVYLPGQAAEPLAIGSGQYQWSYPYQPNHIQPALLSLDSALEAIVEDADAYQAVMHIIRRHNPEFADRLNGPTGISLRQIVMLNPQPDELLSRLETALANSGKTRS